MSEIDNLNLVSVVIDLGVGDRGSADGVGRLRGHPSHGGWLAEKAAQLRAKLGGGAGLAFLELLDPLEHARFLVGIEIDRRAVVLDEHDHPRTLAQARARDDLPLDDATRNGRHVPRITRTSGAGLPVTVDAE